MTIEEAIAAELNQLDVSSEVSSPIVADKIYDIVSQLPEFAEWAATIAAREAIGDRVHGHLLSTRSGATRAYRRRRQANAVARAVTGANKARRDGATVAEIKSVFLDAAYCIDERYGRWLPLRLMTHADLEYVIKRREDQGRRMLLEGAFLRVIAKKVRGDQTVGDVFSEAEIERIRSSIGVENVA